MLKNQIQPLSDFIDVHLLGKTKPSSLPDGFSWREFLLQEGERIKSSVKRQVFEIGNGERASQYLLLQQTELTTLADRLFHLQGGLLCSEQAATVQGILQETLALLLFLAEYFPTHFHFGLEAPLAAKDWFHARLTPERESLQSALRGICLEDQLHSILQGYLNCCETPWEGYQPQTWRELHYIQCFTRSLHVLVGAHGKRVGKLNHHLVRHLFRFNFNTLAFYDYCIGKISIITRSSLTIREQRRELLHLLKLCRQVSALPDAGFDPQAPSIKESIGHYLEEELAYLEKVEHLHAEPCLNGNSREPYPFYFQVSFTASQLAFFVRLMVETGLIITKKKADLHEFIVNHVGTLKKETLSGHSLKNKSYHPTESVVRKVKAQLHLMLQHLNRNFT